MASTGHHAENTDAVLGFEGDGWSRFLPIAERRAFVRGARLAAVTVSLALLLMACQTAGPLSNDDTLAVGDDLAAALVEFRPFLLADDVERSDHIAASDSDTLRRLAQAVDPLYDEINATLDRTDAAPSLTEDEQALETDLHSLAQAAIEAEIELEERGE